jgi:hypothetical protein
VSKDQNSIMKILGFIVVAAALLQCERTEVIICFPQECSTLAKVKDLTGLDGCGFVFELHDGTRLIPEQRTYIHPPKPEEDPLFYYALNANEKVQISYQFSNGATACMAGNLVFITCIKPYGQAGAN